MPASVPSPNPHVAAMSAYTPGEQPQGGGWVKLNTNENPYPPSLRALEAIRRCWCCCARDRRPPLRPRTQRSARGARAALPRSPLAWAIGIATLV